MDFGKLVRKLYEIEPTDISVSNLAPMMPTQSITDAPDKNYLVESEQIATGSLRNVGIPSDLDAFLQIAGVSTKRQPSTSYTPVMESEYVSVQNPPDKVTMDIPLLIRLLEFAREDAEDDIIIHDVAERMVNLSIQGKTLTMDDYSSIIPSERGRMDKEERLQSLEKPRRVKQTTEESIADYLRKAYEAFELKESKKK
jgi:hypothetical protein